LIELVEYLDERGRSVFCDWKRALDPVTRARIQRALLKLEQGNLTGLTSRCGSTLVLVSVSTWRRTAKTLVVLLGGGTKRRQQDDIEAAKARWKSYKERKILL
jgi:putative component of toxin-antitoxin plasmid stabilization module